MIAASDYLLSDRCHQQTATLNDWLRCCSTTNSFFSFSLAEQQLTRQLIIAHTWLHIRAAFEPGSKQRTLFKRFNWLELPLKEGEGGGRRIRKNFSKKMQM